MVRIMYHTQERHHIRLTAPIICNRDDAWLGTGYYFWWYAIDAVLWGKNSKKTTGWYEVYQAEISLDKVLNTSFNLEHYEVWQDVITEVAITINTQTGHRSTIQQLNDYINKFGGWQKFAGVDGILMDDTTGKDERSLIEKLPHLRRIQLVAYNESIITKFAFHLEGEVPTQIQKKNGRR